MELTRKRLALIVAITAGFCLAIAIPLSLYVYTHVVDVDAEIGFSFTQATIHTQIRVYKGSQLILDEYHAGVVTNLVDNMTHYKLWGDSDMQYGALNDSAYVPYISIGNDTGTLGASSTVLPAEWHRELATVDGEQQSQLNFSCTISGADIPGGGSQTADCIGICLTETDDADDLWGYDTFTQVTGIDQTFTINVDIQVSVAHS